jgi:hypothetical protein
VEEDAVMMVFSWGFDENIKKMGMDTHGIYVYVYIYIIMGLSFLKLRGHPVMKDTFLKFSKVDTVVFFGN